MDSVCMKNLYFNHVRSHEMLNNNEILILTTRRGVCHNAKHNCLHDEFYNFYNF